MNTFFSSIFSKIISAVMSILCLFNLAPLPSYDLSRPAYTPTPVVGEADETATYNNTPDFVSDENANKETNGDAAATDPANPDANTETNPDSNVIGDIYQIINDTHKENGGDDAQPAENTDEAQQPADDANTAETPADETANNDAQQPADEIVNGDYDVLETIDISATEDDNVTMTLYAAPAKTQAAPMKAARFSALSVDDENEGQATVTRENEQQGRMAGEPITCIAKIEGNGEMEPNVYRHFVSIDKYVATLTALVLDEYKLDESQIRCEYPEDATDLLVVDENIMFYELTEGEDGEIVETSLPITNSIRDTLDPADMLEYSPYEIDIDEEANITTISEGAFLFCTGLEAIVIPGTVKTIGENAFSYCTGLNDVYIEEGVEVIGERAFMQCRNLESVNIPSTLKRIEANAFAYCTSLGAIELPDSIEFIGDNAFLNLAAPSNIICTSEAVYKLANSRYVITRGRTIVEFKEI